MAPFDKAGFIQQVLGLTKKEVISKAIIEHQRLGGLLRPGRKGIVLLRNQGAPQYQSFLTNLVWFLDHGSPPHGLYEDDFQLMLPIARDLVAKGEMDEKVLRIFERDPNHPYRIF